MSGGKVTSDHRWVTYLDDLISWKLETRDLGGIASHQIPVQDSEDALVRHQKEIVLFTFQLQDDGLQANGQVVV